MKLIDKDALVVEIERIKKEECPIDTYEGRNKLFYFERFLSFLDTLEVKELQEEPVSEDLEEAVNAYIGYAPEVDESSSTYGKRQAFKAGANWKEQQLMAKAVDARCFGFQGAALFSFRLPADKYLVGSEVKVIVIKK